MDEADLLLFLQIAQQPSLSAVARAPAAYAHLASGQHYGKIVINV